MMIVSKVWGHEEWIVNQALGEPESSPRLERDSLPSGYCLKRLVIQPRAQCSMHRHQVKDETFVVEAGVVHFELAGETSALLAGDQMRVPAGTWHRFTNRDHHRIACILEVSTFHDDADSFRREESRLLPDGDC
jgi:mannose-6-phosphate isomerase-like protein (cupin superfamily)